MHHRIVTRIVIAMTILMAAAALLFALVVR
jgi:hypothetical protein